MAEAEKEKTRPSLPPHLYTEEYFLTACEGYEEWLVSEGNHLSRRLASAFAVASVEPGMRVLDVGCGRGEIVRHCAELGADVCGIDYAPVAVQMTRDLVEALDPGAARGPRPYQEWQRREQIALVGFGGPQEHARVQQRPGQEPDTLTV